MAVVSSLVLAACTFERRAETETSQGLPGADDTLATGVDDARDSVLGLVDAFQRALAAGDAARVAQLVGPNALLIDQEEGVIWNARDAGRLPSSMSLGSVAPGDLAWARDGTRVDAIGPARLVIVRYRAEVAGEPVPWWGVESFLIEPRDDGGWRIHYVHRSRGPGVAGDSP
jgi:ketosteroid isomerase-like protein